MLWEAIFFLVLLKIPVVYLCVVVWWAIRAEPSSEPPVAPVAVSNTPSPDPVSWSPRPAGGNAARRGSGGRVPRRPAPARGATLRSEVRR
jgi:hypothetical protein